MIHGGGRMCDPAAMAQNSAFCDEAARLAAIIDGPQLSTAACPAGADLIAVRRAAHGSRCSGLHWRKSPSVWRWQQRFAEEGVDGPSAGQGAETRHGAALGGDDGPDLSLPCSEPPGEATHWTSCLVAKAARVSLKAMQRLWATYKLPPHRLRTFKKSNDPAFAGKVEDIVGLYMNPPAHADVLSIDEKSQIQALARTLPSLPMKPGKCATMTHGYKRNGTTTLFAAMNVLDGKVMGRCMPKHTNKEFITFPNAVERAVPPGKVINAIMDDYATHKHPKVCERLADHPRRVFHFTPTSTSWMNAVEGFFSILTSRSIRRGLFRSVSDLKSAIRRYLQDYNCSSQPFVWAKPADASFVKLERLPLTSG